MINTSISHCQGDFLKFKENINNYRNILKIRLYEEIKKIENIAENKGVEIPEVKIIKTYPAARIDTGDENDSFSLIMDTLSNGYILSYDSKIRYITSYHPKWNMSYMNFIKKKVEWKEMIEYAEKKSGNVFFLIFDYDISKIPIVGYYIDSRIEYIDEDLKIFQSINDLIKYRYGSFDSYFNEINALKNRRNYINKFNNMTLADAIYYYRKNPINYFKHDIYNKDSIIKATIFRIEEFCDLTAYQKKVLKNWDYNQIFINVMDSKYIYEAELYFNKTLNENILKKVLYNDQLSSYLLNVELFNKFSQVNSRLIIENYFNNIYIKNDTTNKEDFIIKDEFYYNIVFGDEKIPGADTLYVPYENIIIK